MHKPWTKTRSDIILIGIFCLNCVFSILIGLEFGNGDKIGLNWFTLVTLLGSVTLTYLELYVFFVILDFLGNPNAPYALYSLSLMRNRDEPDPEKMELLAKKYNERIIGKYVDWGKWDYTATPEEINAYKLRKQKISEREQERELKIRADNEQVQRMMGAFGRAYLTIFILGVVVVLLSTPNLAIDILAIDILALDIDWLELGFIVALIIIIWRFRHFKFYPDRPMTISIRLPWVKKKGK